MRDVNARSSRWETKRLPTSPVGSPSHCAFPAPMDAPRRQRQVPVRLPPDEDETLTSWVLRLAWAHSMPVTGFVSEVCGKAIGQNQDWDGAVAARLIAGLSASTGARADELRSNQTLLGLEGRLFGNVGAGPTRWVLPRRSIGPYCHRPWMQFCPQCLKESQHFRRSWRLSLRTACPTHAVRLENRCPSCRGVVNYFRATLRSRPGAKNAPLALCDTCEFDLRVHPGEPVGPSEVRRNEQIDGLVSEGEFVSRGTKLSSLEFLSGFWNLTTSLVGTRTRLRPWRVAVSASSGIDLNSERFEQKTFDFLSDPRDRAAVVAAAMWLLEEPERLRETMRKTQRRASDITLGGKIEPWLRELLEEPPRPRRAPSPGEKRKADMAELRRRLEPSLLVSHSAGGQAPESARLLPMPLQSNRADR